MEVSEEVRAFLAEQVFAVLCLSLDLGSGDEGVVIVKTERAAVELLREAEAPVSVGWCVEGTDHGPVVCLLVRVEAEGVAQCVGEVYFDPDDPSDLEVLGRLAKQARLPVAFLDEELVPAWFVPLPWDEVRRLEVDQVLDRAVSLLERADAYDGDAARAAFQETHGIDDLVGRVFSPQG